MLPQDRCCPGLEIRRFLPVVHECQAGRLLGRRRPVRSQMLSVTINVLLADPALTLMLPRAAPADAVLSRAGRCCPCPLALSPVPGNQRKCPNQTGSLLVRAHVLGRDDAISGYGAGESSRCTKHCLGARIQASSPTSGVLSPEPQAPGTGFFIPGAVYPGCRLISGAGFIPGCRREWERARRLAPGRPGLRVPLSLAQLPLGLVQRFQLGLVRRPRPAPLPRRR